METFFEALIFAVVFIPLLVIIFYFTAIQAEKEVEEEDERLRRKIRRELDKVQSSKVE